MKNFFKLGIHHANQFMNKPWAIIIVLVLLFTYFAIGNIKFEKENQQLLLNTKRSADNTNIIIKQQQVQLDTEKKQIADLQQHIDCIVALFTRPNRTSLVIADINSCQLMSATNNSATSTSSPPKVSQAPAPKPQSQPVSRSSSSPSSSQRLPSFLSTQPSLVKQITNFLGSKI